MRNVDVKFLRPGQVVADAVTNAKGAVLCPMGYKLTEQAIERLKNASIATVWIEGSRTPGIDIEGRQAALDQRFAGISDLRLLGIKSILQKRLDNLKEEYGG